MTHIWAFEGINQHSKYRYYCVNCGLKAVLEVFGELDDLGRGIVCFREPVQLELL